MALTGKLRTQVEPDSRLVGQDDRHVPSCGFHHLQRIVDGPHHDMLPSLCRILSEPLAFSSSECMEEDAEDLAGIPKVFTRNFEGDANMGEGKVGQMCFRSRNKARVPKAQQDSGRKERFPIFLSRNNLVHELEESVRVILNLDVDLLKCVSAPLSKAQRERRTLNFTCRFSGRMRSSTV